MKSDLYYECHITIEPVFGERLDLFTSLCMSQRFKPAKFFMQKRAADTPERSRFDSFCTGHDTVYETLVVRMYRLIGSLQAHGFKVWRYKIEDTLIDSRNEDVMGVLA